MAKFSKIIEVRWSDVDMNHHVRHSAYADFCTHARIEWLAENGFTPEKFAELVFGPVIFKEETEYFKEVKLGERLTIEVEIAGASADNSRFRFRQHIYKQDGRLAARHEVAGAWLDMRERKLIPPPAPLAATLAALDKSEDFEDIPLSRKAA